MGCLVAGMFYQLPLKVPEEARDLPPELGGSVLPDSRGPMSEEWRQLLEKESPGASAPTAWNGSVTEQLVQPYMYGRFMEYGHNGAPCSPRTYHSSDQDICKTVPFSLMQRTTIGLKP